MSGKMSRRKGAAGERELANFLFDQFGIEARRGVQYSGGPDSPDVVTELTDLHIECKRVEALQLYKAMEQARSDSKNEQVPVVFHRKNNKPWLAIIEATDLVEFSLIINKWLEGYHAKNRTDEKNQKTVQQDVSFT